MRYSLLLFLFLSVSLTACQSIDVGRFLENRYCPKAFVLKGRESTPIVELGKLDIDCSVSWSGEIDQENFRLDEVNLEIGVWMRLQKGKTSDSPIPLFANVLYGTRGGRGAKRERFTLKPKVLWRKHTIAFSFTPEPKRNIRDYRVLVGLAGK